MSKHGYSLVEVIIAAAIIAVGLTAATALVGTLMQQQELNAATLRAANLQEQAAKLFRLDLHPSLIREILPEVCAGTTVPPAGGYSLVFSRPVPTNVVVDGATVALEVAPLQLVYESVPRPGPYITNRVTILRPSIRVEYDQN